MRSVRSKPRYFLNASIFDLDPRLPIALTIISSGYYHTSKKRIFCAKGTKDIPLKDSSSKFRLLLWFLPFQSGAKL